MESTVNITLQLSLPAQINCLMPLYAAAIGYSRSTRSGDLTGFIEQVENALLTVFSDDEFSQIRDQLEKQFAQLSSEGIMQQVEQMAESNAKEFQLKFNS